MTPSALTQFAPLLRMGVRSIRKAPLRNLLVFLLVAFVVGAGTLAAIANRSTSATAQDVKLSEFGGGNFLAEAGLANYSRSAGGYVPAPTIQPVPVPQPPESPREPTPEDSDRGAADAAWLADFDLAETEQIIEDATGIDVSIARRASAAPTFGPFGSAGTFLGMVSDLDLAHPASEGVVSIVDGRRPNDATEIATAIRGGDNEPSLGDLVSLGGSEFTVVGLLTNPANRFDRLTVVTPEAFDQLVDPALGMAIQVRADLPNGDDQVSQMATAVSAALGRSTTVRSPDSLYSPNDGGWTRYRLTDGYYPQAQSSVTRMWPILISGLLATQIALVCAAAFAVGIRRRTKEFGQLLTIGADDRHIRGLAYTEAALLGGFGALLGLVVGVLAASRLVAAGWLDSAGDRVPTDVRWSLVDWLGPAAIGIVAVVLAAWWPTRVLTRAPIPGVLEGRLPSVPVKAATPRWGLALVAGGAVFLGLGSQVAVTGSGDNTGGAFALLLVGVIATIAGAILLIGTLLSLIGRRADRLPLLARLAVRNSDRQRSRSWVVVGAFIAALAVPVAIGASIKAYPNSYDNSRASVFESRLLVTSKANVYRQADERAERDAEIIAFDADYGDVVAESVAVEGSTELVTTPGTSIHWVRGNTAHGGGEIIVATPELLELLNLDDELVAELDAGRGVDVSIYRDGTTGADPVLTISGDGVGAGSPIEVVVGPALFDSATLVSEDRVASANIPVLQTGTVRLLEQELSTADEAVIRQRGNELWTERFGAPVIDSSGVPIDDSDLPPWLELRVNHVHQAGPSANQMRFWSTLASVSIAIIVAVVTSALSAVEMTGEIESMIATGASPSIRRRLLGAQTLYHLMVAGLMAVPLAVLGFWVVTRADDYAPPGLTVPWLAIALAVVVIPAVVALVITATFRNGRPAVSRRLS